MLSTDGDWLCVPLRVKPSDRMLPPQLPGRPLPGRLPAASTAALPGVLQRPDPGRLPAGLPTRAQVATLPPPLPHRLRAAEPGLLVGGSELLQLPAPSLIPAAASSRSARPSPGCSAARDLSASSMPFVASFTWLSCTSATRPSRDRPPGSWPAPLACSCRSSRVARCCARCRRSRCSCTCPCSSACNNAFAGRRV